MSIGITPADFTKFNLDKSLYSTLAPGRIIYCGRGILPEIKPEPSLDGSCFVYRNKTDDSCSVIAASNGLNVTKLEELNKNAWGWNG